MIVHSPAVVLGGLTLDVPVATAALVAAAVCVVVALLEARGFHDVPRDDTWECNFVLGDAQGRLLDVHSCTFDAAGNHIFGVPYPYASLQGHGAINGFPVQCITPEWLVAFHTGYPVDANDYHDVSRLCQRFGIAMPEIYARFVGPETTSHP